MTTGTAEQQLEFFGLSEPKAPRPRRDTALGQFLFRFRYDQLMLVLIGALLGVTVIYAGGVERGKQLARAERALIAQQPMPSAPAASVARLEPNGHDKAATPGQTARQTTLSKKSTGSSTARSQSSAKPAIAAVARYAIQVVTYSQPQLAQHELQGLQARGERAFLLKRDGRTIVCVGPFPSQDHASQKLTTLRTRYQDCFIKTL